LFYVIAYHLPHLFASGVREDERADHARGMIGSFIFCVRPLDLLRLLRATRLKKRERGEDDARTFQRFHLHGKFISRKVLNRTQYAKPHARASASAKILPRACGDSSLRARRFLLKIRPRP
jgi:hypothetical protein